MLKLNQSNAKPLGGDSPLKPEGDSAPHIKEFLAVDSVQEEDNVPAVVTVLAQEHHHIMVKTIHRTIHTHTHL